jgi:hypothetical protein
MNHAVCVLCRHVNALHAGEAALGALRARRNEISVRFARIFFPSRFEDNPTRTIAVEGNRRLE